jgi:Zn-dependent M28 family amino/carboxypeptidase
MRLAAIVVSSCVTIPGGCGDAEAPSGQDATTSDTPTGGGPSSTIEPTASDPSTDPDTTGAVGMDESESSSGDPPPPRECDELDREIDPERLRGHLAALDAIAQANGDNRSVGTPGYDLSVAYVREQLAMFDHASVEQTFDVNVFAQTGPASLSRQGQPAFAEGTDFAVALYSAAGSETATARAVDVQLGMGNTSDSGCEPGDFAGFPAGDIAVLQRGTCNNAVKVVNAQDAGASAVLIFNQGNSGDRFGHWVTSLGATTETTIPVVTTRYEIGASIANAGSATVSITVDASLESRPTSNIVLDVGSGDEVIMLGAHLDSVPAGPGINDNGTGSAALLEVARVLSGCATTRRVRFAWWAAEEVGLVGSTHYVASLDAMATSEIVAYMNFDMIGSPNYVRFRYDGDGSAYGMAGPMGSGDLEDVFADYFDGAGLATGEAAFDGRSDYGPFVTAGIAAGGLFTGAEGVKSPEQAEVHGGAPGQPYDGCYHAACDGADNVDDEIHLLMTQAIAHAIALYAL